MNRHIVTDLNHMTYIASGCVKLKKYFNKRIQFKESSFATMGLTTFFDGIFVIIYLQTEASILLFPKL